MDRALRDPDWLRAFIRLDGALVDAAALKTFTHSAT
jgi:hypothetical protein